MAEEKNGRNSEKEFIFRPTPSVTPNREINEGGRQNFSVGAEQHVQKHASDDLDRLIADIKNQADNSPAD